MFKRPRVNVIESDDGYSVEVLGRTGLLYTEKEKSICIDSEVLNGSTRAVIKKSTSKWEHPYEKEFIDDNKRNLIVENIRQALRFDGAGIEIW